MSTEHDGGDDSTQWQCCYETAVEIEAHVVKGYLEHYDVPCVLDSNRFSTHPLTFGALGHIRVLVPQEWMEVALGLLASREQQEPEKTSDVSPRPLRQKGHLRLVHSRRSDDATEE